MSDEKNESRVTIEDLPRAEQELTPEEAKDVKGGLLPAAIGTESAPATRAVSGSAVWTGIVR